MTRKVLIDQAKIVASGIGAGGGSGSGGAPPVGSSAWTGDPRTYDYAALTGPRVTNFTTMQAPVFLYPVTGALPSTVGAMRGGLTGIRINPVTVWDPNLKSKSTDNAGALNVEGFGPALVDSFISTSGIQGTTGLGAGLIDHCYVENTNTPNNTQGCLYRGNWVVTGSRIRATQDGLWIGEYTRQVALARFASGDFTDPFVSKVLYSLIEQTNTTYGYSTISPSRYNFSTVLTDWPGIPTTPPAAARVSPAQMNGWVSKPATQEQIQAALPASLTQNTTCPVGSFIKPPPGVSGANSGSGVFGGLYQVVGTTDGSATAQVGTDYQKTANQPGWPQSTTLLIPFVSGTAIMYYLGGVNHSDAAQMSRSNGHILWYRSKLSGYGNAATFICQPSIGPATGAKKYDPAYLPTSYLRVEECLIVMETGRSTLAYVQGSSTPDPFTGVVQYPAYGYSSAPNWVTFKNCYLGNADQLTPIGGGQKLYYSSKGESNLVVATEARRFTGVMAQLDPTGVAMMTAANGGTMPTGSQVEADNGAAGGLRATLIKAEYQGHIYQPTDGYNGTPDNIGTMAVFQNRLAAKITKPWLDARKWVVWQNLLDAWTGAPIYPNISPSTIKVRPWLAVDGSDNGFYIGSA